MTVDGCEITEKLCQFKRKFSVLKNLASISVGGKDEEKYDQSFKFMYMKFVIRAGLSKTAFCIKFAKLGLS